jgi:hypothetical protein
LREISRVCKGSARHWYVGLRVANLAQLTASTGDCGYSYVSILVYKHRVQSLIVKTLKQSKNKITDKMALRQLSKAIFMATSLLSTLASAATTDTQLMSSPTATPTNIRQLSAIGCFATTVPMVNHGPYIYQTSGNCQQICLLFGNTAMGLGNGTDCWCGDAYPPASAKVDDAQCNTPCAGYGTDTCTCLESDSDHQANRSQVVLATHCKSITQACHSMQFRTGTHQHPHRLPRPPACLQATVQHLLQALERVPILLASWLVSL